MSWHAEEVARNCCIATKAGEKPSNSHEPCRASRWKSKIALRVHESWSAAGKATVGSSARRCGKEAQRRRRVWRNARSGVLNTVIAIMTYRKG